MVRSLALLALLVTSASACVSVAGEPTTEMDRKELAAHAGEIYEAATGESLGRRPCVTSPFDGAIVVGSFAHDRGCKTLGGIVDDTWIDSVAEFRDAALKHAGWSEMDGATKKRVIKRLTRTTMMGGSIVGSRKKAFDLDDAPTYHEDEVVLADDGSATYTFWFRFSFGRTTKRKLARYRVTISADGEFSQKSLERWSYDRQDLERKDAKPF